MMTHLHGLRHWATVMVLGTLACGERPDAREEREVGALGTRVVERAVLRTIALDTLSDSAHVLSLIPEADGDAIAFRFADPAHGVTAGLGLIDRARPIPQLGWPDSVSQVRWRAPHELVFTVGTGEGVRVIIDAHASTLVTIQDLSTAPGAAAPPGTVSPEVRARATRFVDSTRFQPDGRPQQSALRYAPTRFLTASRDSVAVFHVAATDSVGRLSNPTWYLLDLATGGVQPIDSIIGPMTAMPPDAGAWTDDGTFLYTKGLTLYELRVRRDGP
jgi:hypothetical protein